MLSNCARCQYFNHHPHHKGDIRCAIAPGYTAIWQRLKSLDESTLNTAPINSCSDFEIDSHLGKKEVTLSLSYRQWQKLIIDFDCAETILNAFSDKLFEHSLSLAPEDWQAIAIHHDNYWVLNALEQRNIIREEPEWINVSSSCIEAARFDRSQTYLYLRFSSHSVYQYSISDGQICTLLYLLK